MDIVADITKDDVVAYNMYHFAHSPAVRQQGFRAVAVTLVVLVVWSGLLGVLVFGSDGPLDTARAIWPLLLGPPLFLLVMILVFRRRTRRTRKTVERMLDEGENKGLFGEHRITLTPEGVNDSSDFHKKLTSWDAVERVAVTDQHLFVYTNAIEAVIVPRRSFPNEASFTSFVEAAKRFHSLAHKDHTTSN